ncbi:unnamed protein product [Ascophyllum nodosum]
MERNVTEWLQELEASSKLQGEAIDAAFLLICSVFVFLMQFGFAALEVGTVRPKNTKAVLLKNIADSAIGAIAWWLFGHGVAFGSGSSNFIGQGDLFFSPELDADAGDGTVEVGSIAVKYAQWMLQWAFAATSTTIVSGAIAERVALHAYIMYAVVITALIYPVLAHWVWSETGWASSKLDEDDLLLGCGAADFSGSGVVHLTGGLMAFIAAKMTGARGGRFDANGKPCSLERQSPALNVLGTLTLWTGWFFFNASGVHSFSAQPDSAAKSMLNTSICPSSAAVLVMILQWLHERNFDPFVTSNGVLGGLVAITASSPMVRTEGSFVIGLVSGLLVFYGSRMLLSFKIDDVVDASVVHGLCGFWGMLATGLFTTEPGYARAYDASRAGDCCGVFYGCGGRLLGANVVLVLALMAWAGGLALLLFGGIKYTLGLRIDVATEHIGMDKTQHPRSGRTAEAVLRNRTPRDATDPPLTGAPE